jgi:leucyl/phenylalanyl-tRNA--protein transferase
MRFEIPREYLPQLLHHVFPFIAGPEEIDLVIPLLDERGDGDFCACLRTDPEMIACACRESFLPMSEDQTGHEILLVKAHEERSVLEFGEIIASKSTVRRSRELVLRVDVAFEETLYRAVEWHEEAGRGRWLTESLCGSLIDLHHNPRHGVQARSVELYRPGVAGDAGVRVAGEVGYSCGAAYTSLSGYYEESGMGGVQLVALGQLLAESGFAFWDLGMELEYKFGLGARLVDRDEFRARYLAAAAGEPPELPHATHCRGLVERARRITVARRRG